MKKCFLCCMVFLMFQLGSALSQNHSDFQIPIFSLTSGNPVVNSSYASLGSSWADYDNDGDPDLFIAVAGNNRLYRNNGNFNFTPINDQISNDGGSSSSAIWGDYNNDGYLDIFVSNNPSAQSPPQANFLYQNSGPPNYNLVRMMSDAPALDSNYTWSSSWVDFDNDGDLDLHMPENKHLRMDYFYKNNGVPDGNGNYFTPDRSHLFINDSLESTGSASWIDYDNDCDQDLFLIKSGRSHPMGVENHRMFHNNLNENGVLAFQRVISPPMMNHLDLDFQASWADYDNDGDLDVFLGNFDDHNYLYRNEGDSLFTRITQGAIVTSNKPTLGSAWGDYDNDGDLDLFVNNTAGINPEYYENDGNGNFLPKGHTDIGTPLLLAGSLQSCSNADVDNDGYLDLLITSINQDKLYRNSGGQNHFLEVTLKGVNSNSSAIGAKVRAYCTIDSTFTRQMRFISGNPTGDKAQNSMRLHFGLGDAQIIDTLIVEWPGCSSDTFTNINVNSFCEIDESGLINCQSISSIKDYQQSIATEIEVFPNPGKDVLNLQLNREFNYGKMVLTDMLGSEVLKLWLEPRSNHKIPIASIERGVYILKLSIDDELYTKTIILE